LRACPAEQSTAIVTLVPQDFRPNMILDVGRFPVRGSSWKKFDGGWIRGRCGSYLLKITLNAFVGRCPLRSLSLSSQQMGAYRVQKSGQYPVSMIDK
jgi:hypothetical protein